MVVHKMKFFLYIFLLFPFVLFAQKEQKKEIAPTVEEKSILREANDLYKKQQFTDAEVKYKKALETNPTYARANYNLGNAIYEQNRFKESVASYELGAKLANDPRAKADAFHNLGDAFMLEKKYSEAVEAFKNALRNDPSDEETRYNLALAQKMLKQQQKQDDNKDKDNKDNKDQQDQQDKKDQNKDKKQEKDDKEKDKDKDQNQDKNKDQEEKKKDKDQGNNQDKNEEQKPKPRPNELSKQQMEQLLEAMNNEENKTQKKVNAKKAIGRKVKQEKDW